MVESAIRRYAFRVDASLRMGTGHVMRCLTLANALRHQGIECQFICREHPGNLFSVIYDQGFELHSLPVLGEIDVFNENQAGLPAHAGWLGSGWKTDAQLTVNILKNQDIDWLIVDHYALDYRWENFLRASCKKLMVIDDLADRNHNCDLLLDQNLGRTHDNYSSLIPSHASTLIGTQYALLRPEFANLRCESLIRRASPKFKNLLIAMGGVDGDNITGKVLDALAQCNLPSDIRATVILGLHAPWLNEVKNQVAKMSFGGGSEVLSGVNNMAQLMTNSDLAIGAAGGTAWERCSLGLPSFILTLAENQRSGAAALQKIGAAIVIDRVDQILDKIKNFMGSSNAVDELAIISKAAANIVDGYGLSRVIEEGLTRHG